MAFVVYELTTTITIREPFVGTKYFKTVSAAKAYRTRNALSPALYGIASIEDFRKIEKKVLVKNLLSGELVEESVNTPNYLSVASESYWSA